MFLSDPSVISKETSQFNGPWLRLDPYSVPSANGLKALNVSYTRGQVSKRYGHSVVFSDTKVSAMYNWLLLYLGANANWLVYYVPSTGVRQIDLANLGAGAATLIAQTTAAGASFVGAGTRLYVAYYDATGVGKAGGNVYSWGNGADPLFAGPIITPFDSISETGSGVVTAGTHRFAYVINTRNGYVTQWCPIISGAFTAQAFTSAGLKNIAAAITATWPAYAASVQLLMTTAANPNQYFIVPGAVVSVPASTHFTATFPTVSISDGDLAATATDAGSLENLLSCSVSGTPPFYPAVIFPYGERMGYVTRDGAGFPVCYFSDPSAFQQLTAAQHGVYLPQVLRINTGAQLRGVAYLFGPHWTYSCADNGLVPAQWADPQLVDGSIGTLSPNGVYLNAAQGFLWVADESGLYLFQGGTYPAKPISYYQYPDWQRINWAAPTAVSVFDDKTNKRVEVLAPLDGATVPTHRLVWDYTDGLEPEVAKYELTNLAAYPLGAAAMVENPATNKMEVWLGPGTGGTGAFLRQNDGSEANPYRDVASAINAVYETALNPGLDGRRGQVHFHHADHVRVKGAGGLALKVWGLDHVRSVVPAASPLAIGASPGLEYLFKYFLQSEHATVEFSNNALDEYFVLSFLKHYYTLASPQR